MRTTRPVVQFKLFQSINRKGKGFTKIMLIFFYILLGDCPLPPKKQMIIIFSYNNPSNRYQINIYIGAESAIPSRLTIETKRRKFFKILLIFLIFYWGEWGLCPLPPQKPILIIFSYNNPLKSLLINQSKNYGLNAKSALGLMWTLVAIVY